MNHNYSFWTKNPAYETDTDNNPEEVEVKGEIKITTWGSGPSWEHPGDPAEFEVIEIIVNDIAIEYYLSAESKTINPEWEKWEEIVNNHIENDFDWAGASEAADSYAADLAYDEYRDR